MSTNKIVLKDVDQVMADYVPAYQPFMPLFLGNAQQYSEEVGKINFKRLEAVGNLRAEHITPKDTDIKQISVKEGSKVFKKYFLAKQYRESNLQDQDRLDQVVKQVLDAMLLHQDLIFVQGEGTSNSDVINNALFWSGDANLTVQSSAEVDKGSGADYGPDLYAKVMAQMELSSVIAGRKAVIFYGSNIIPVANGFVGSNANAFKSVMQAGLGSGVPLINLPAALTPASNHGFMVVNLDQVKLHYTKLPSLKAQGINEENMYSWHNFLYGSCMLELLQAGAVTKQPLTLEA